MAFDPKIICFRHCDARSVFCKIAPNICPICHSRIKAFNIEPFLIPYPYTSAADEPNTVVIRPSQGNFLNDYSIVNDLHIGITNLKGIVFEYDKAGLIVNDYSRWTNCMALNIIPSSWDNQWNIILKMMLKDPKWTSENYNDVSMNCFNFVIEFINNLHYMNINFVNKENMCEKLLLPKINDALKYNAIYKKLRTKEFLVS